MDRSASIITLLRQQFLPAFSSLKCISEEGNFLIIFTCCSIVFLEQDYRLMQEPVFRRAVLRAIAANKDNSNVCHKWKGKAGSHVPITANLPATLTGAMQIEGKIDSCGVMYFGGLFILTEEIQPEDVNKLEGKLLAVPRCTYVLACMRMCACLCASICLFVCTYTHACAGMCVLACAHMHTWCAGMCMCLCMDVLRVCM
jgi:hypothetical protein